METVAMTRGCRVTGIGNTSFPRVDIRTRLPSALMTLSPSTEGFIEEVRDDESLQRRD
jgi:hypothetical protein